MLWSRPQRIITSARRRDRNRPNTASAARCDARLVAASEMGPVVQNRTAKVAEIFGGEAARGTFLLAWHEFPHPFPAVFCWLTITLAGRAVGN